MMKTSVSSQITLTCESSAADAVGAINYEDIVFLVMTFLIESLESGIDTCVY